MGVMSKLGSWSAPSLVASAVAAIALAVAGAARAQSCPNEYTTCDNGGCCLSSEQCCPGIEEGCCNSSTPFCCGDGTCAATPSQCASANRAECDGYDVPCGGGCAPAGSDCCDLAGHYCGPEMMCTSETTCVRGTEASLALVVAVPSEPDVEAATGVAPPFDDPADASDRSCALARPSAVGARDAGWLLALMAAAILRRPRRGACRRRLPPL
jgi:hypothetical protein